MRLTAVVTSLLLVCTVLGVASSAQATTVSPAGAFTLTSGDPEITVNGLTIRCSGSNASVSVTTGGTGTVTNIRFTGCRHASLGSVTVTVSTGWSKAINTISGAVQTIWSSISKHFRIDAIGCNFWLTGTQSIVNSGAFPLTMSTLAPAAAGSSLTASGATGCLGLVNNGNAASFKASYALSVPQTIS